MECEIAKTYQAILYCQKHLDKMWAATIVGILLDCDFRDSERAADEWIRAYFLKFGAK